MLPLLPFPLAAWLQVRACAGSAADVHSRHRPRRGSGRSIAMAIGGARECLFAEPGVFNIIVERRLGFVRIALETGASLVSRKPEIFSDA